MSSTQQFHATGLTCGHCAHAVTDELLAVDGVSEVRVDVVAGGASTVHVTGERELGDAEVAAALDEAGEYALVRG